MLVMDKKTKGKNNHAPSKFEIKILKKLYVDVKPSFLTSEGLHIKQVSIYEISN